MNMIGFDLETTGVDVETDRPVAVATIGRGGIIRGDDVGLVNPGCDIPTDATAVHGITTWVARQYGTPERYAVQATINRLTSDLEDGYALVGMNLAFDLTILDRRAQAHGIPTLCDRLGHCPRPVLDVMELDHLVDPYRKGRRTLTHLAAHYGVDLSDAHNPAADVNACLDLVPILLGKLFDPVSELPHQRQKDNHTIRMGRRRRFFLSQGVKNPRCDPCWPVCHGEHAPDPTPAPASADAIVTASWDAV